MSPLELAILHLKRKRLSSWIAIFSIALSVALSGLLFRLYLLSSSRFSTLMGGFDSVVGAKAGGPDILLGSLNLEGKYPDFIPLNLYLTLKAGVPIRFEDGRQVQSSQLIDSIVPMVFVGRHGAHRVIATEDSILSRGNPAVALASGAWPAENNVVLGSKVAESAKTGDPFSFVPWVAAGEPMGTEVSTSVAGILKETGTAWDEAIFIPLASGLKILEGKLSENQSIWKNGVLHYVLINSKAGSFSGLQSLVNRRTVAELISVGEEKNRLVELTGTGKQIGLFISGFLVLLASLAVASLMVTRFDSMGPQLAILRALGFRRREIRSWLLWEGFLLGGVACVIGAVIDGLMLPWIRSLLGASLPSIAMPLYRSWPIWACTTAALVVVVFVPLWRLYRLDVHRLLRNG